MTLQLGKTPENEDAELVVTPRTEVDITTYTTEEIRAEIEARGKALQKLIDKRHRLAQKLAELDQEIRALQGDLADGRDLADAVADVTPVETIVSTRVAAKIVRDQGVRRDISELEKEINGALKRDERFQRVAHGQYQRVA